MHQIHIHNSAFSPEIASMQRKVMLVQCYNYARLLKCIVLLRYLCTPLIFCQLYIQCESKAAISNAKVNSKEKLSVSIRLRKYKTKKKATY